MSDLTFWISLLFILLMVILISQGIIYGMFHENKKEGVKKRRKDI